MKTEELIGYIEDVSKMSNDEWKLHRELKHTDEVILSRKASIHTNLVFLLSLLFVYALPISIHSYVIDVATLVFSWSLKNSLEDFDKEVIV